MRLLGATRAGKTNESSGRRLDLRVVTVKELSDLLRVHPSTIYRLVRTGHLPAFRVGDSLRFNLGEIEEWFEKNRGNRRRQQTAANETRDEAEPR